MRPMRRDKLGAHPLASALFAAETEVSRHYTMNVFDFHRLTDHKSHVITPTPETARGMQL
jgi:hypothetical protein